MADKNARTAEQIEADIAVARERLSQTVDELAVRAQPKAIAKRSAEGAKAQALGFVQTPQGEMDKPKLAKIGGAVLGVVVTLVATKILLGKRKAAKAGRRDRRR